MARSNGSGDRNRRKDDEPDPERTQRTKPVQKVVDDFFSDDPADERSSGGGR